MLHNLNTSEVELIKHLIHILTAWLLLGSGHLLLAKGLFSEGGRYIYRINDCWLLFFRILPGLLVLISGLFLLAKVAL